MDFFKKNLAEVIKAINILMEKNGIITVKKIRIINQVKSSDRSKINFIWRSLKYLVEKNVLKVVGKGSPKSYALIKSGEIDLTDL